MAHPAGAPGTSGLDPSTPGSDTPDLATNDMATALPVLLVEDDHGDAVLVQASLAEIGVDDAAVIWTRSLGEAITALVRSPGCVLLDLGLPDAEGYGAVHKMVESAPDVPVIVLTGRQERDGIDALAAGAQDYIVKDAVTGDLLRRSVRYAVERKRAERAQQQLREVRLSAAEQARLERGLLPTPLLRTDAVECTTYYRPGRDDAVLGGDFYDVVQTEDGAVHAVIGDVMGHGADEAALGVHLRVAWRTLLLAGVPEDQLLPTLTRLLATEQPEHRRYVTACTVTLTGDQLFLRLAGHPAPILCTGGDAHYVVASPGAPLGVRTQPGAPSGWPSTTLTLAPDSSLLLYTDGLLDSYAEDNPDGSIGIDELVSAVANCRRAGRPLDALIPTIVGEAPRAPIDDTAAVLLTTRA